MSKDYFNDIVLEEEGTRRKKTKSLIIAFDLSTHRQSYATRRERSKVALQSIDRSLDKRDERKRMTNTGLSKRILVNNPKVNTHFDQENNDRMHIQY